MTFLIHIQCLLATHFAIPPLSNPPFKPFVYHHPCPLHSLKRSLSSSAPARPPPSPAPSPPPPAPPSPPSCAQPQPRASLGSGSAAPGPPWPRRSCPRRVASGSAPWPAAPAAPRARAGIAATRASAIWTAWSRERHQRWGRGARRRLESGIWRCGWGWREHCRSLRPRLRPLLLLRTRGDRRVWRLFALCV